MPSAALANDLHQTPPISWDDAGFQGSASDCRGADLAPGEVLWHFVHTDTKSGDLPSTIDAQFASGSQSGDGYVNGNSIVMYELITGHTTLNGASDSIENDGLLNLSHICVGKEKESESVPVETESVPVETESVPVETESVPVETESVPVETESVPVETESVPVETESVPVETESVPVETESVPVETESIPDGSVEAETGTPEEQVTPPSTDTLTPSSTPSNDGWQLVLIALAALLSTALILTPASRKARRK